MKTATVADLRNHFPTVFRWIEEGEAVNVTRRGKVVARLLPVEPEPAKPMVMPDFEAIQRDVFGEDYKSRVFERSIILDEREGYDR